MVKKSFQDQLYGHWGVVPQHQCGGFFIIAVG
jgi:hypothetical protein